MIKPSAWYESVKAEFLLHRNLSDIHVDEFFPDWPGIKVNVFHKSKEAFLELYDLIKLESEFGFDIQLNLSIELISDSSILKTVPANENELIELIDIASVPEILLFAPVKQYYLPSLEYYCSPLPFKLGRINNEIKVIYAEYRTMEEWESKSEFSRWLTISYLHARNDSK